MLNCDYHYNNKYKIICQAIWQGLVGLIILILPLVSQGSLIDELDEQIQEQEMKKMELERQAEEYQQIINQKQKEIKSLKNQIAIYEAQIGKLIVETKITEDKIDQTKLEILQLEYGLGQTEDDINEQKRHLTEIIQTIAEYDEINELEMILQSDNFSDFFNQLAYLDNLQEGVQNKVKLLKSLKQKLSQDKETKEEKKESLEELKGQLTQQQWSLASQRKSKEAFLTYTRGEESRYQDMLAHVEAQKKTLLGDINRLRQLKAAELARLKELLEKPPPEYWASTNWYYRQDDPRWGKINIGLTDSKLEDYGCAITSVAMILKYWEIDITPQQLAKESIYYYDLIVWPKRWGSISCVNCPPPHSSFFDWFRLDRELGAGYPVIVFVKANGRGAGHYVVIHHKTQDGRYVVHDPLFGDNIYLDSTQVYISNLYETTTNLDQMVIYH